MVLKSHVLVTCWTAGVLLASPDALSGQATRSATARRVEDCGACPIQFTKVAAIVDEEGWFVRYNRQVVGTSDGRYVVIPKRLTKEPPPIFGADGKFIGRLGRAGEGPGEVGMVSWLNTLSDGRLQLISRVRVNEFTATGELIRTAVLRSEPRGTEGVRMRSGAYFVANSELLPPKGDLNPLYVFDSNGAQERIIEFGNSLGLRPHRSLGPAAAQRGDVFWVAESIRRDVAGYTLRLLDRTGSALDVLRHEPPWVRTTAAEAGMITAFPYAIRETSARQLIVLVARPRTTLKLYLSGGTGHPFDYFETVVLIIDVSQGRVIGETTIQGFPQGILDNSRIVTSSGDKDDVPTLTVWRLKRD